MSTKKTSGSKPTHRLGMMRRGTEEKGSVGAAWLNDNGNISITLNIGVVLTQSADLVLTLSLSRTTHDCHA